MSHRRTWPALVAVGAAMVVWALVAPAERQLGDGIRLVYLHVATTWAGLMGIYCAGLLGLGMAIAPSRIPVAWPRALSLAGLSLFAVGFVLSLASAQVSWGGILWMEPRLLVSVGILALGWILVWMTRDGTLGRGWGLAWVGFASVSAWSLQAAGLFFHPDEPIATATAASIRWTFYGMFALSAGAGALLVSLFLPSAEDPE